MVMTILIMILCILIGTVFGFTLGTVFTVDEITKRGGDK